MNSISIPLWCRSRFRARRDLGAHPAVGVVEGWHGASWSSGLRLEYEPGCNPGSSTSAGRTGIASPSSWTPSCTYDKWTRRARKYTGRLFGTIEISPRVHECAKRSPCEVGTGSTAVPEV